VIEQENREEAREYYLGVDDCGGAPTDQPGQSARRTLRESSADGSYHETRSQALSRAADRIISPQVGALSNEYRAAWLLEALGTHGLKLGATLPRCGRRDARPLPGQHTRQLPHAGDQENGDVAVDGV